MGMKDLVQDSHRITRDAEVAELFAEDVKNNTRMLSRNGHDTIVVGDRSLDRDKEYVSDLCDSRRVSKAAICTRKDLGVVRLDDENDFDSLTGQDESGLRGESDYSDAALRERFVPLDECLPYEKAFAGNEGRGLLKKVEGPVWVRVTRRRECDGSLSGQR
ncbi:MAG: hypothetical protein FLDDKLPJ_01699 [Phycisphaerae bacterium]|nr:hypothetical protein [Phycisphaerae bacterium]